MAVVGQTPSFAESPKFRGVFWNVRVLSGWVDFQTWRLKSCSQQLARQMEAAMEKLEVLGEGMPFQGPFGERRLVYCDHTASGRSVRHIEDYLTRHVLPLHANLHFDAAYASRRCTAMVAQAEELIRSSCNCSEDDVLIFEGSGATSAVKLMIPLLSPAAPNDRRRKLVVITGPLEHLTNLKPWMDAGGTVLRVNENAEGLVDEEELERMLMELASSQEALVIGSFSAGSNLTGVLQEQDRISSLLHRYGAFAFWDFAACAAYAAIDMNPKGTLPLAHKDAVFLSPHKLLGGISCPGLVLIKRHMLQQPIPWRGTPPTIGIIRCGLSFQLKDQIGVDAIHARELELRRMMFARFPLRPTPDADDPWFLRCMGPAHPNSIAIFSFVIGHATSHRYLHHNFVCALLNDLFGIQARGTNGRAEMYVNSLLGLSESSEVAFSHASPLMRPGFTRLNLHYLMTDAQATFVIDAMDWISRNGWKLLSLYTCDEETGLFTSTSPRQSPNEVRPLGVHFNEILDPMESSGQLNAEYFASCIADAERIAAEAVEKRVVERTAAHSHIRWYLHPHEAVQDGSPIALPSPPFSFKQY